MVSFYLNLPQKRKFLFEDEKICINRLKLYKLLQEATQKFEPHNLQWNERIVNGILEKELVDYLLLLDNDKVELLCTDVEQLNSVLKLNFSEDYNEDDYTGHFLLGLVCSTSEELKSLFINLEAKWFQLKFELNIPEKKINKFLKQHGIIIPQASLEEVSNIKNDLSFYNSENLTVVFKLSFIEAPNMLVNREVLIKNGFLYFPNRRKYITFFLLHFVKTKWREKLNILSNYWVDPDRDERLVELVNNILPDMKKLLHYSGQCETGILPLEKIDEYSKKLFPLCMSQLHHFLQQKNHLKHYARKQYAVFLKNAGMSYEDAIELFESEMTKKISEEDFRKRRYFYYFTHVYGLVGGMLDYLPQNCEDIINHIPSGDQEHGCPFAHYSEDKLKDTLDNNNVGKQTISDILDQVSKKQYKNACCLYFKEKVGSSLDCVNSPNNYFSCAVENYCIIDIEDIFTDC